MKELQENQQVLNASESLPELIKKIERWAEDRNIIKGSKPIDQAMKLFSEFGELSDNVGKGRDCRDDVGDVFVVLTIMAKQFNIEFRSFNYEDITKDCIEDDCNVKTIVAALAESLALFSVGGSRELLSECLLCLAMIAVQLDLDLIECVQVAYNDIEFRKGVMFNGVFIKESDTAYQEALKALGK